MVNGYCNTPVILVIIGPHGAGKTTIGKQLASLLDMPFSHELGRELREQRLKNDADDHAVNFQPDFDRLVIEREMQRDFLQNGKSRIIETWHPGNLAYAFMRSSAVFSYYASTMPFHLKQIPARVIIQPLRINYTTALARLNEPGPNPDTAVSFFHDVATEAEDICRNLGLTLLTPLFTDCISPECICQKIIERLVHLRACR